MVDERKIPERKFLNDGAIFFFNLLGVSTGIPDQDRPAIHKNRNPFFDDPFRIVQRCQRIQFVGYVDRIFGTKKENGTALSPLRKRNGNRLCLRKM